MTGTHLLIAAVIIAFVIAFVITMLVLNDSAKKIISTNTKLVENQNTLLEQNKMQGTELEKRMSSHEVLIAAVEGYHVRVGVDGTLEQQ